MRWPVALPQRVDLRLQLLDVARAMQLEHGARLPQRLQRREIRRHEGAGSLEPVRGGLHQLVQLLVVILSPRLHLATGGAAI